MTREDIGVPEALPKTLEALRERLDVCSLDTLWIFPPLRRGRREQGLVAVSAYQERGDRRTLVTVSYSAEQTGRGTTIEPIFTPEGEAPAERFPVVIRGVVTRGGADRGEPREIHIEGSPERFNELLGELMHEATQVAPA